MPTFKRLLSIRELADLFLCNVMNLQLKDLIPSVCQLYNLKILVCLGSVQQGSKEIV